MKRILLLMLLVLFTITGQAQVDDQTPTDDQEKVEPSKEEPKDTIDLDDIDFDDVDLDDIEEDELSRGEGFPWQKFAIGGQIGNLQFGDQTAVSLAPEIVFNATDFLQFGVDGVYEYYNVKKSYNFQTGIYQNVDYKERNTAGRLFTRFVPVKSFPIFAQLDYERMRQENVYGYSYTDNNGVRNYPSVIQNLNNFNGGLGFYNGPYYLGLMYNFVNKKNKADYLDLAAADLTARVNDGNVYTSEDVKYYFRSDEYYPNAIAFRAGLNIPLGQGDKNKKRKKRKKPEEEPEAYRYSN